MAPRIPPSLNWLIKTRARLDGELQKTKVSLGKAQKLIARLDSIQKDLAALDRALGLHDIKVDPKNIAPIRSHFLRVKVPRGELTRSILLCLRLCPGRQVRTREIVAFVAARFAFARRPAHRLPQLIAQRLWGAPMPDEERTANAIRRALMRNPSVLGMVGADALELKTARLLGRLVERLDPYEVNPTAWVWIIDRAARWSQIEAKFYGAPRSMQRTTRIYISAATEMAKEGQTRAEIAELLGIQRSAISNWLRRGVAPELAAALAAHPDGRTAPRRRPGIARRSR